MWKRIENSQYSNASFHTHFLKIVLKLKKITTFSQETRDSKVTSITTTTTKIKIEQIYINFGDDMFNQFLCFFFFNNIFKCTGVKSTLSSDMNSDLFYDCDVDSISKYESASNLLDYSYATSLASSIDCSSLRYLDSTHL